MPQLKATIIDHPNGFKLEQLRKQSGKHTEMSRLYNKQMNKPSEDVSIVDELVKLDNEIIEENESQNIDKDDDTVLKTESDEIFASLFDKDDLPNY